MKAIQFKYIAAACMLALSLVNHSFAVDAAEAAGVMADLETLAIQAKAKLANASLDNLGATEEASQQSDAIDKAVEAGRGALAAMEAAIANGDEGAAEAAENDLAAALRQASDAFEGVLPAAAAAATRQSQEQDDSDDDAGRGQGPPNIYDVPWKSQGIRAYYESLFGKFEDARAFGAGKGFGDRDATPE